MRGSLQRCNRGSVGVLWGQSNSNRCGNKSGSAAALGYSMPAGATYWENGGQLLSYTAAHLGPEVGIFHEAITVAGRPSCTLVKYGFDGSSLGSWNTPGHADDLIAHCVTAGVVPQWGICVQGEAEATTSEVAANSWAEDCVAVLADFRAAWGAGFGCVFVRIRTTDDAGYPWHANVRTEQDYMAANFANVGLTNVDDGELDEDLVHYLGPTAVLAGRRAVRILLDAGVF